MSVIDGEVSATMGYLITFHTAYRLPVHDRPSLDVEPQVAKLRADLISEEAAEFAEATARADLVALADALSDIVYACYGAAVTYGIDLDATLREVHRANMSKLGPDGRPVTRADGKVLKSANYLPPRIDRVLAGQRPLPIAGAAHRAGDPSDDIRRGE
jgi:predicted HAD superfamily Cof-like phosphohydrolase